ncbi:Photosystem I assembly protein Ycf3 [Labeo rohita]|uniref:Photosystem I assembly protein Ycf3 n=1 Tax=Labeo rohita TaxID=84645 RepID=A0ABQ8L2F1_LABRO|nr:Photosystem I assembly protein Ycf3 [Labeo rohita]
MVEVQRMKLSHTAAMYMMFYGIAMTFSKRTLSNIRKWSFSVNTDKSTSNSNKKVVTMMVSYYHENLDKSHNDIVIAQNLMKLTVLHLLKVFSEKVISTYRRSFPLQSPTLQSLPLDPSVRGDSLTVNCLKELALMMKHLTRKE